MNKTEEILQVTRGVLVVDENLQDLIKELRERDILIVKKRQDMDDEYFKTQILPDRIFVTNHSKDFILDATSYGYKLIGTEEVSKDAKTLAKIISDALINCSLWTKRHCWILTLKPDGNHVLTNLVD